MHQDRPSTTRTSRFARLGISLVVVAAPLTLLFQSPAARAEMATRPLDAGNPFAAGNVVIYRVGTGSGSLVNTGNPVFLDEYTPSGTLVQSVALPTAASGANKPLIASGTASSEGLLSRSADKRFLILTGYAAAGTCGASCSGTASAAVNRVIGRVDANADIDTSTALSDYASANNPRSAASADGTAFWSVGGAGAVRYATLGATTSTQLNTDQANLRQAQVIDGQLYASSGSGTNTTRGVNKIGAGLPTIAGQTLTRLSGLSDAANASSYSYALLDLNAGVSGVDTLYLADDTNTAGVGGIQKWSLVGGNWISNGTIGTPADAYRGLTAVANGGTVTIFATRKGGTLAAGGGELVSLADSSGYNAALVGTPVLLANAAANTAFRGVALAPENPATATATPTNTPESATATSTDTPAPVTSTPTNTSEPAAATSTATNTPLSPSATPVNTATPAVCSALDTPVGQVQGSGETSPLNGQTVTVQGVVVGDYEGAQPNLQGFYLQDTGDGDATTSDGVFIFDDCHNYRNTEAGAVQSQRLAIRM